MNLEEIKAQVAEILSLYPKPWKLEMEGRYGQPVWWIDPLPFNVLNESPEVIKLLGFIAEFPEIVPALIAEVELKDKDIDALKEAHANKASEWLRALAEVERLRASANYWKGLADRDATSISCLKLKLTAIRKAAEPLIRFIRAAERAELKGPLPFVLFTEGKNWDVSLSTEDEVLEAKDLIALAEVIGEDK